MLGARLSEMMLQAGAILHMLPKIKEKQEGGRGGGVGGWALQNHPDLQPHTLLL